MLNALDDSNPDVRFQASKSLAEIGEPAVEPLVNALKGEEGNIKRYATFALKNIGDENVVDYLIEALEDDDWSVRKTSAKSLGEMESKDAVEPLIEALKDEDWGVRTAVAKALGDIGDQKAIDPLKKLGGQLREIKNLKKLLPRP